MGRAAPVHEGWPRLDDLAEIGLAPGIIRIFPPPRGSDVALLEISLVALLRGLERHPPGSADARRLRSAIRDRGREALATGGQDLLAYLRRRIAGTNPALFAVRETILDQAWLDLFSTC